MDVNGRVDAIDEEFKLLKNEIKQVLLEIQEHVLNVQNPFTGAGTIGFAPARIDTPPAQAAPAAPSGGGGAGAAVLDAPSSGAGGGGGQPATHHEDAGYSESESRLSQPRESSSSHDTRETRRRSDDEYAESRDDDTEERSGRGRARSENGKRSTPSGRRGDRMERRPEYESDDERSSQWHDEYEAEDTEMEDSEGYLPLEKHRGLKMDLITLAGIAQWTDKLMRRVGKEQTQNILEVVANTGRISEETKNVILALIPVFEKSDTETSLSTKQVVALLAQLDGLMGTGTTADAKLLPFLLQDDLEVFPSIPQ